MEFYVSVYLIMDTRISVLLLLLLLIRNAQGTPLYSETGVTGEHIVVDSLGYKASYAR